MNKRNWLSIHYLRGLAAVLVVIHHIPMYLKSHGMEVNWNFYLGSIGVDIFFIISGFVMYISTLNIDSNKGAFYFFARRLVRIVPLYWTVTLALFSISYFLPGVLHSQGYDFIQLIKSLLFIPYTNENQNMRPIISQGWTLNFEMFFYVILTLSLLITHTKAVWGALTFLIVTCVLNSLLNPEHQLQLLSPIVIEFCFGLIAAHFLLSNKVVVNWKLNIILIFVALFGIINISEAMISELNLIRLVTAGALSFLLIINLLLLEKELFRKAYNEFSSKILTLLGDASYSIYLTHGFAFSITWTFTKKMNLNSFIYSALFLLSAIFLGIACYYLYEKVLTQHLNKTLKGFFR